MTEQMVSARRSADEIQEWLVARVAGSLGIFPDEVEVDRPVAELGIASYATLQITADLEAWLGSKVKTTLMYDFPTIQALSKHLAEP